MLCQWATDQAQAEGVPIVLQSTAAGRRTYEKAGFEEFDELSGEGHTGVPNSIRLWSMVWEPRGREGEWLKRAKVSVQEFAQKSTLKTTTTSDAVP